MQWESPDHMEEWLGRRYAESLRRNLGIDEARRVLSREEEERHVRDAMEEIAQIAAEDLGGEG